jgi:hypothetical protein
LPRPERRGTMPPHGRPREIALRIGENPAQVGLRLPTDKQAPAIVRQALVTLGAHLGTDADLLDDAELAVGEAVCGAIRRSRRGKPLEVDMWADGPDLVVIVRHRGRWTLIPAPSLFRDVDDNVAATIIQGVSAGFEVRGGGRHATEVVMRFDTGQDNAGTTPNLSGRVTRSLAAVTGAQADLPTNRLLEAMRLAEMAAHYTSHTPGDDTLLALDRLHDGLELRIGPLEAGGADALVRDSDFSRMLGGQPPGDAADVVVRATGRRTAVSFA